jgi:apolipoprotein N-acyltransferase
MYPHRAEVRGREGWRDRRFLLVLLAGSGFGLALPPFGWWPLAFLAPIVPAYCLDVTRGRAALIGASFGLGYFALHLAWLGQAFHGWFGWLFAIPVTAVAILIPVVVLTASFWLAGRLGSLALLALPFLWVLADWTRSIGPLAFPWGYPGYALAGTPLIQVVDLGGVHLATLLVIGTATLLAHALRYRSSRPLLLASLLIAAAWGYGSWRLSGPARGADGKILSVSIVQGAVDPLDKAVGRADMLERHLALTERAPGDLVVWPETAILSELDRDPRTLARLQRELGNRLLLTGAFRRRGPELYNSAYLLQRGRVLGFSDKMHLVPGGERLLATRLLAGLYEFFYKLAGLHAPQGLSSGRSQVLPAPFGPLGTYISYESAFPDVARAMVRDGAVLLAHLSNDAWFGDTSGPTQHLAMGRVRAIETRRYLIRASNDGVSGVIDPRGRLTSALPRFEAAVLDDEVVLRENRTPYVRFGDWVIYLSAVVLAYLTLRCVRSRAPRR